MATQPQLPPNFRFYPADGKKNELWISGLYLHHSYIRDPDPTHHTILSPIGTHAFGATVANNWAIHNGPDLSVDAIVARAQGLHMLSGNWNNYITIVFEIDGLKGSTLHAMGVAGVEEEGQWGIVGGTGKFATAKGFIGRIRHKQVNTGNIVKLDIHVIYENHPWNLVIKDGPKGGSGGGNSEPAITPYRLNSMLIQHSEGVVSIESTYIDQCGIEHTHRLGGHNAQNKSKVELGPEEFLQEITGTVGKFNFAGTLYDVVTSIKIVTNLRTLGPYGKELGTAFSLPEKKGGIIVGFFGRTGGAIDAIGVFVRL